MNIDKIKNLFDQDENMSKTLNKSFQAMLKSEKNDKVYLEELIANIKSVATI